MTRARLLGGAVVVLALLLLGASLMIDALARSALTSALSRATGTEATVGSVDVGILSGRVTLEELRVANPEGLESPRFLSLERGRLAAGLATLFADTVEVRALELDGLDLTLEQRGTRSNVGPILASLREASEARDRRDATAYRIREVVVRDVTARIRFGTGPGDASETVVRIREVRLEDVGTGGGGALVLPELTGRILQAVLEAVARESADLPGSLRGFLQEQLRGLPGAPGLRPPDGEGAEGLREEAEERLRQLVPGRDG